MKNIQKYDDFELNIKNEDIPDFDRSLVYKRLNNKRNIFRFRCKRVGVALLMCIVSATSVAFATSGLLNGILYNDEGESVFEISLEELERKYDSEFYDELEIRFGEESKKAHSQLKNGEILYEEFRRGDTESIKYTIKEEPEENVSYDYDRKTVSFDSSEKFKEELGDWAAYPEYLPKDAEFTYAGITYTISDELQEELRNEVNEELYGLHVGHAYSIAEMPEDLLMIRAGISFNSEEYGVIVLSIEKINDGMKMYSEHTIKSIGEKMKLSNGKEVIVTENGKNFFYVTDSNEKNKSFLYEIRINGKPSQEEAKKILESIEAE